MALFVDLGDDDSDPPQDFQHGKPVWKAAEPEGFRPRRPLSPESTAAAPASVVDSKTKEPNVPTQGSLEHGETPNWNSTTEALGCYPIIVTIAASLDLNSLDNLSRTCRQVRAGLLQYRTILLKSSLRCINESKPVDPEQTLRYRARAGNWFYMEDMSRTGYSGKPGSCARDMVSECRRCGTVVCRNCAIKPPAPIALRHRHRRLCKVCTKAPIAELVKPALRPTTPLTSDIMQSKICHCETDGVWLCQPCGRGIRAADHEYRGIWRWRNQYGEVLGGVGIGIGEGDRGVPCGREVECHGAKECEHETDCDAADAAADSYFFSQQQQQQQQQPAIAQSPPQTQSHHGGNHPSHHTSPATWAIGGGSGAHAANNGASSSSSGVGTPTDSVPGGGKSRRHTPSPGYARHEIEGIGGVVKTKLVRMVKVGAGVPEWEDEKARGEILGREVVGRVRSWCGWCNRVVPGQKDVDRDCEQQRTLMDSQQQQRGKQPEKDEKQQNAAAAERSAASPTFASSVVVRAR